MTEANMKTMKQMVLINNEKGFVLLAAIFACVILFAVGMLAIYMSTGDIRSSAITVGDKKALAGAESGVHRLVQDFDSQPSTWTAGNNYTQDCTSPIPSYIWRVIDSGIDANTRFAVCRPVVSSSPPVIPSGYDLAGGGYGIMRYDATVVGQNTSYKSLTKVDVGIGFGPVPLP